MSDICEACDGSGMEDPVSQWPCRQCGGTGWDDGQEDDVRDSELFGPDAEIDDDYAEMWEQFHDQ